ncbi:Na/Pi cotransporter family protein [Fodinicurvata halophila]|uniref:Na/Pi cotransporter family protein n=1 Tax=Fodinicurvata halophila TaxID=1419723 RepID=UPI00363A2310
MELFSTFFAGLGLLFIGIHFIADNLKRLTGRNFRRRVTAATRSHASAAAVGVLAGGLTQSSNAVTLIAISMIQAGLTGVSAAMPLVAWSNVGTAGLVLLSAVDLRVMVLFLLGLVGMAYYFNIDRSQKYRHVAGALLGIGLLFFGLQLMKEGAAPLRDMEWVVHLLQVTARFDLLEFITGLLFALLLQSSATVTIIAVSMVSLGILTFDQTILLVLGAGLGSGIGVGLTAYGMEERRANWHCPRSSSSCWARCSSWRCSTSRCTRSCPCCARESASWCPRSACRSPSSSWLCRCPAPCWGRCSRPRWNGSVPASRRCPCMRSLPDPASSMNRRWRIRKAPSFWWNVSSGPCWAAFRPCSPSREGRLRPRPRPSGPWRPRAA